MNTSLQKFEGSLIVFLQWCRENIVIPGTRNQATGAEKLAFAIGNFSYLGTIGDFIKARVANAGLECQFDEKPAHEIQALLDPVTQEPRDNKAMHSMDEFTDDAVLEALEELTNGAQGFEFDFDDSDEQIIEENNRLSTEMLGSRYNKLQQRSSYMQHDQAYLTSTSNLDERNTK